MYLFVGLLYPDEDAQRILKNSKVGLQSAANNFQWALIKGISSVTGEKVNILNSMPMGTFPKYNKILFEKSRFSQSDEASINSFGYLNLPLIKQIQRERVLYKNLSMVLKKASEKVTIFVYSLYNPYLKALARLKEKYSNFNYILIVPDLPGNLGLESSELFRRFINRILGKNSLELSNSADAYVLLTERMKEALNIIDKPCTVVEGVYGRKAEIRTEYKRSDKPVILYTGALEKALGLDVLIEAFEKLPKGSAKLSLAGHGGYLDEIKLKCEQNEDIEYLGYLSVEEIEKHQNSAAILVNPRSQDEEFVKYSFPSKTMEYLATGVPVVMNRLPGIPKEYEEYIFYTESSSAESLAKKLEEVLKMSEELLLNKGQKSTEFINSQKSSEFQARKVIELAKKLF